MCTVSWLFNTHGYELFFNRDELNCRQRAQPPKIKQLQNTRVIAPTDVDAGGTWISVNEHGLTLCLLNNYAAQAQMEKQNWISRGLLVKKLSHFTDTESLLAHFKTIALPLYRPFNLLMLSLSCHIWQLSWNGVELRIIKDPAMPLTSSSFATDGVIKSRLQQFNNDVSTEDVQPQQLKQYHASHLPEPGAFSVCMHRDNGQTVSYSHICVSPSQARFNYFDGSPCEAGEAHTTELDIQLTARPHVA